MVGCKHMLGNSCPCLKFWRCKFRLLNHADTLYKMSSLLPNKSIFSFILLLPINFSNVTNPRVL